MKIIGITGGVGAGKSELLKYMERRWHCHILMADEAAHSVKRQGTECYQRLVSLLGREVLEENGEIDRIKMAEKIFADAELLCRVNETIHPAVKQYILDEIRKKREDGNTDYFLIEAALLIEDGYEEIVDELWYIRADEAVRRQRLKAARRYTDDKIDRIIASQLKEEEFISHAQTVIDNSADLEDAYRQIDEKLRDPTGVFRVSQGKEHEYRDGGAE